MKKLALVFLLLAVPAYADELDDAQAVCNQNRNTTNFRVDAWRPGFEKCAEVNKRFKAREKANIERFHQMNRPPATSDADAKARINAATR